MKIAVLGSAGSSVQLAPFTNDNYRKWVEGKTESLARAHAQIHDEFEIWGCSPGCWAVIPRATRWFEVHRWEPGRAWFSPEYCQFLRDFKGIVYTGAVVEEIPSHQVYPIDEMEEKFSSYFMTSSLALMTALAIDTIEKIRAARAAFRGTETTGAVVRELAAKMLPPGVDQAELDKEDKDDVIGMWGVDMAADEEYVYQRPGCQFFVIEAQRRGIGFYLPPESDLMRPKPVYGVSEWYHNYIKLTARARELSGRAGNLQKQIADSTNQLAATQGEQYALNYFVDTWTSPYGYEHGLVSRQAPGTGLGGGVTSVDTRPAKDFMSRAPAPTVLEAMAQGPEVDLGRMMLARLGAYSKEVGFAADPKDLVERIFAESSVARRHSAMLQDFAKPQEASEATLQRVLEVAVGASPKAPTKARSRKKGAAKRKR